MHQAYDLFAGCMVVQSGDVIKKVGEHILISKTHAHELFLEHPSSLGHEIIEVITQTIKRK